VERGTGSIGWVVAEISTAREGAFCHGCVVFFLANVGRQNLVTEVGFGFC
jgi:hypothetical protein